MFSRLLDLRTYACVASVAALLFAAESRAACEAEALSSAAAMNNVPESELSLELSRTSTFQQSGQTVHTFKYSHSASAQVFVVHKDVSCHTVDFETVYQENRTAELSLYGKKLPSLAAKLSSMAPADRLSVIIWFAIPADPVERRVDPGENPSNEQSDASLVSQRNGHAAHVAGAMQPFVARIQEYFPEATYNFLGVVPLISLELTKAQILQAEAWPEVLEIYDASRYHVLLSDVARESLGAEYADTAFGLTGVGATVGVIEHSEPQQVAGLTVSNINPANCYTTTIVREHATNVAGVVKSTASHAPGIAQGATVYSGCASMIQQQDQAMKDAMNAGVHVLNISQREPETGVLGHWARLSDYYVQNYAMTVVAGAGNDRQTNGLVGSPASAYNAIGVGYYNHRTTVDSTDDTIGFYSSFVNPNTVHGDHEKPDLAAPGLMRMLTRIDEGTSFASPVVAGASALAMQAKPWLKSWPEAVKAVHLAATDRNIEGASRQSDFDGAGSVSVFDAINSLFAVGSAYGIGHRYVPWNCSSIPQEQVIGSASFAGTGTKARVAMAWDSTPTYAEYRSRPSADFDLRIRRVRPGPFYDYVAGSYSMDGTVEIAEWNVSVGGTYEFVLVKHRCSESPRYLGISWWQK